MRIGFSRYGKSSIADRKTSLLVSLPRCIVIQPSRLMLLVSTVNENVGCCSQLQVQMLQRIAVIFWFLPNGVPQSILCGEGVVSRTRASSWSLALD